MGNFVVEQTKMKNLLIIVVTILTLTGCTKEQPQQQNNIIGRWEVYYYCINGTEIQPEFEFNFTETICTLQSIYGDQIATGNYSLVDSVLKFYWSEPENVYNCTIEDNEMTLIRVHETLKLRRK